MSCCATPPFKSTSPIANLLSQKRPSAEAQLDSKVEAPAIDHKNIPMIKFLREKGEKKVAEKRSLRRTQGAGVGSSASKGGKAGQSKGDKEKEKVGGASNAKNNNSSGANGSGLSVLKVKVFQSIPDLSVSSHNIRL